MVPARPWQKLGGRLLKTPHLIHHVDVRERHNGPAGRNLVVARRRGANRQMVLTPSSAAAKLSSCCHLSECRCWALRVYYVRKATVANRQTLALHKGPETRNGGPAEAAVPLPQRLSE